MFPEFSAHPIQGRACKCNQEKNKPKQHLPQKDIMWLLSAWTNFLVTASSIICFTWETERGREREREREREKHGGKDLIWHGYIRWQGLKTRSTGGSGRGTSHEREVMSEGAVHEDNKQTELLMRRVNSSVCSRGMWFLTPVTHPPGDVTTVPRGVGTIRC